MCSGGIFGNLFDFNGDGELNAIEHAVDLGAFVDMVESEDRDDDRE